MLWPKAEWEGKNLFQHITLRSHPILEVSQDRNWRQECGGRSWWRPWRGALYCRTSPGLLSLLFLYPSGPPARGSTSLNMLDPAYSSLVRICPTGSSSGQSYRSMFSIVAASFQIIALFKLTNNKQTNRTPNLDRVGAIQPVVTLQERMPPYKETQAPGRTRLQLPSYKPGEAKDSPPTPRWGEGFHGAWRCWDFTVCAGRKHFHIVLCLQVSDTYYGVSEKAVQGCMKIKA